MKQSLAALFFTCCSALLVAQKNPVLYNSAELLASGIAHFNAGQFEDALEDFELVHPYDTNYQEALDRLALTYIEQKRFEDAEKTSRKALALDPDNVKAYINLGNALEFQERYEDALATYEKARDLFPNNEYILLNQAQAYESMEKPAKAFETYQELLDYNPVFPSAHLRLGMMALKEERLTQGLLSLTTFLVLEPSSGRSLAVLALLDQAASLSLDIIGEASQQAIPQEFEQEDLLVNNRIALNKKYEVDAKFDYASVKQLHLVLEQLKDAPTRKGFWSTFYLPFYQDVFKKDDYSVFSLYLLASSTNEDVAKEVSKKMGRIREYMTTCQDRWREYHKEGEVMYQGEVKKLWRWFYDNGQIQAYGNQNAAGENDGLFIFKHYNGRLMSSGTYVNGQQDGTWTSWHQNGDTSKVIRFKNGVSEGDYIRYSEEGVIAEVGTYRNGELDGAVNIYYPTGQRQFELNFSNGKNQGLTRRFYKADEAIELEYNYESNALNGNFKEYHTNGNLRLEKNMVDNLNQGIMKEYYPDGTLASEQTWKDGLLEGPYKTYHNNGQLMSSGMAVRGSVSGKWMYYRSDGRVDQQTEFDANGKITGEELTYDFNGNLLTRNRYNKGALVFTESYDEDGTSVLYTTEASKGKIYAKFYSPYRQVASEGVFEGTLQDGEWKYYNSAGQLIEVENYKDGVITGLNQSFYTNGDLYWEMNHEGGFPQGPYREYYSTGQLRKEGNYNLGQAEGMWYSYYPDGTLEQESWWTADVPTATTIEYSATGSRFQKSLYNQEGTFVGYCSYDTSGALIDSISLPLGTGTLKAKGISGKLQFQGEYIAGQAHGVFKWFYPNGDLLTSGEHKHQKKEGHWLWYHPNGKLSEEGEYFYDKREGEWIHYSYFGTPARSMNYLRGKLEGQYRWFDHSGKLSNEINYVNGDRHGPTRFFDPSGQLKVERYYDHGKLVGYSYETEGGSLIDTISIQQGTAHIVAYYANGQQSVDYRLDKGWFEGEMKHFYPSGQLQLRCFYAEDDKEGEEILYYENGEVSERLWHQHGTRHGAFEQFYPNGQPKVKGSYRLGKKHGTFQYFDAEGQKLGEYLYFNDHVFSMMR